MTDFFKAAVPKAEKIKSAELSGFATLDHPSDLPLATVLGRDAARQGRGGQPTVLVRLSGQQTKRLGFVGIRCAILVRSSAKFNGSSFSLSLSRLKSGGDLDALLTEDGFEVLRLFWCDLPPPPDFSFASVGGGARPESTRSRYTEHPTLFKFEMFKIKMK
jgi:hypothetical protein